MPAEYEECVKNYIEKGVSEKSAKARCAAMFYKRHGITINEWVKQHGESMSPLYDYDEPMFKALIQATEPKKCNKHKVLLSDVRVFDSSQLDDGLLEIIAAREGSLAYTDDGYALTWTSTALQNAQSTWVGKPVSINHQDEHIHGKIKYSWFDENDLGLHQIIELDSYLKGWVLRNISEIGVSIEAFLSEFDDFLNILGAEGKGVTIVLPPHLPACSQEDGCKILASEIEPVSRPNIIEDEKIDAKAQINSEEDIMSDEKKDGNSVINAEQFDAIKAEKAKLESTIDALNAELMELRAFKVKVEKEERENLLSTIKEFGLDPAVYEKNDNEALKLIVATAINMKKMIDEDPVIDSGAKVSAKKPSQPQKSEIEIEADEVWKYVYGEKKGD